jgi:nitrile hydratase subunit alpha
MSGHDPGAERREHLTARINGLEDALVARGLVQSTEVDEAVELYRRRLGPQHGATLVARAWTDDGFRARLLEDATAVLQEEGYDGKGGRHDGLRVLRLVVVENTPQVHHLIVCTLCSCYPLALLGPPPRWYKSAEYRARAIRRPRDVLAEFGVTLEPDVRLSVWDSTADCRYLVLPQRPPGTEGYSVQELAGLVTTESLIGTQRTLGTPAGLTR